jgi:hypothetical protein
MEPQQGRFRCQGCQDQTFGKNFYRDVAWQFDLWHPEALYSLVLYRTISRASRKNKSLYSITHCIPVWTLRWCALEKKTRTKKACDTHNNIFLLLVCIPFHHCCIELIARYLQSDTSQVMKQFTMDSTQEKREPMYGLKKASHSRCCKFSVYTVPLKCTSYNRIVLFLYYSPTDEVKTGTT